MDPNIEYDDSEIDSGILPKLKSNSIKTEVQRKTIEIESSESESESEAEFEAECQAVMMSDDEEPLQRQKRITKITGHNKSIANTRSQGRPQKSKREATEGISTQAKRAKGSASSKFLF
jgi:hypothetical protein